MFYSRKVNKHGISYDNIIKFTDEEINIILEMIQVKYFDKIIIKEWSPKDKDGNIIFNQSGAHNNCLKLLKNDNVKWCASIDIDEFIVLNDNYRNINEYLDKLPENVASVQLDQYKYKTRFQYLNKLIIDILPHYYSLINFVPDSCQWRNPKNIFLVEKTDYLDVHWVRGKGNNIIPSRDTICFNHYNLPLEDMNYKWGHIAEQYKMFINDGIKPLMRYKMNNIINNSIKNTIKNNSKNYILNKNTQTININKII